MGFGGPIGGGLARAPSLTSANEVKPTSEFVAGFSATMPSAFSTTAFETKIVGDAFPRGTWDYNGFKLGQGTAAPNRVLNPDRLQLVSGSEANPRVDLQSVGGPGVVPMFRFGDGTFAPDDRCEFGLRQAGAGGRGFIAKESLRIEQTKPNAYAGQGAVLETNLLYNRSDVGGTTIGGFGIYNNVEVGNAGNSPGVVHGFQNQVVVRAHDDQFSEHTPEFRALVYTNSATAGNAGRGWLADWNMHSAVTSGGVASKHALWSGLTVLSNYYSSAGVTEGPSFAIGAFSRQARGGGASSAHLAHQTYPINAGLLIAGKSGLPNDSVLTSGFTNGVQIGNGGVASTSGWMTGATSRVTTGVYVSEYTTAGVQITTPIAGGSPKSMIIDAGAGNLQSAAPIDLVHFAGDAYVQFIETGAVAAPPANCVRLYSEDNGAGKTKLMARFNTGAAQQVAIQP